MVNEVSRVVSRKSLRENFVDFQRWSHLSKPLRLLFVRRDERLRFSPFLKRCASLPARHNNVGSPLQGAQHFHFYEARSFVNGAIPVLESLFKLLLSPFRYSDSVHHNDHRFTLPYSLQRVISFQPK